MCNIIGEVLEENGLNVSGKASNVEEAIKKIKELDPDVVTVDIDISGFGSEEVIEKIKEQCSIPIVIFSADLEKDSDRAKEFLDKDVFGVIEKPSGKVSVQGMDEAGKNLVKKVNIAATESPETGSKPFNRGVDYKRDIDVKRSVIVVGSSAGGPQTLEKFLSSLPLGDIRIIIVQHMPGKFTNSFSERLDESTVYNIREAFDGASIRGGEGLVASGDYHLEIGNYNDGRLTVRFAGSEPINNICPSVDVTMESAAKKIDDGLVGIILTGIGKDGAKGIKAIKENGGKIVVQDEETSKVFGMPKTAINTGYVDEVCPIDKISDKAIEFLKNK